ncbi:MAG: TOTE conflict system archaeo-eukaryotic primase domain-containing protein [Clostridia bacterium]
MSVIPGKYIDKNGNEAVVLAIAADGDSGEKTVIYRMENGGMFTLPENKWEKEGRFTPSEEVDLENYLIGKSSAELTRRIFSLFSSRNGVYNLQWRNSFGAEGYNYACENHSLVSGCYRGIDSCKNCKKGRLTQLSEKAVAAHLNGESVVGIYPVDYDDCCRFLVMELESRGQLDVLRQVCAENDIPCYGEIFGKKLRLWIFFAEKIHIRHIRRLGNALITKAMERSAEISFDLYDKVIPCRDEIAGDSLGFQLVLPFGKTGRNENSRFIDEDYVPLPHGAAEIFRVRTVTKPYLADRLNALGNPGLGRLWDGLPLRSEALDFPTDMEIILDGTVAIPKSGLSPKTLSALKRTACVKAYEAPFHEFQPVDPCVYANFTEDEKYLRLPRGLWGETENLLKISQARYTVSVRLNDGDKVHFSFNGRLRDEQSEAVRALSARGEGIFTAPLGWGKTAVVAALIAELKTSTLILTADEKTRLRWVNNILTTLGTDAERSGSKVHVRLITDKKIKDRYGLVILADCSRLPMDKEIFRRISGLSPKYIYGITASDRRRDGMWGFIHMLCGPAVFDG